MIYITILLQYMMYMILIYCMTFDSFRALEFLGRWQRRTRNAGDAGCGSWICTSEQGPRTLKNQTKSNRIKSI